MARNNLTVTSLATGANISFVIKTFDLGIPFRNQTRFVALNGAIKVMLDLVNPFATNALLSGWERLQSPSVVGFKSFHALHAIEEVSEVVKARCEGDRRYGMENERENED